MVSLFYYEKRGHPCLKVLCKLGRTVKVVLFPYEGWAAVAANISWKIKLSRWNRKKCKITEISASGKKISTTGKLSDTADGMLYITGQFTLDTIELPYFQLILTSHVSNDDFRAGYALTGMLQRGRTNKLYVATNCGETRWGDTKLDLTHFAMVRRKER